MENLYCIKGIVEASKSFSREEGAPEQLEKDLMAATAVSANADRVTESILIDVLSTRVATHCLMKLFYVIVQKYKELGWAVSEPAGNIVLQGLNQQSV